MLEKIRSAFRQDAFLFGFHCYHRLTEHGLRVGDLVSAIGYDDPEIIENYPADRRGPTCLIRGVCQQGIIHVVCTLSTIPFVITVYRPNPDQWDSGFRKRS